MQIAVTNNGYISNIPWKNSPGSVFSSNEEAYLEAFSNIVEVPNIETKVNFYDDLWDFRPYFKDKHYYLTINFNIMPDNLREYAKFFAIQKIIGGNKIITVNHAVKVTARTINEVFKNKTVRNIQLITSDDIIATADAMDISYEARRLVYLRTTEFLKFLVRDYELKLPIRFEPLEAKISYEHARKKRHLEENKTPKIPDAYFEKIIEVAKKVMKTRKAPFNQRVIACIILIVSQTGLRFTDLVSLKKDALFAKKIVKSGLEANYIEFFTSKPSKDNNNQLKCRIFANELCVKAFKTLQSLRKKSLAKKTEYLIVFEEKQEPSENYYPLNYSRVASHYKKFFYTYLPAESAQEWDGIGKVKYVTFESRDAKKETSTFLNIPSFSQYRVQVCTSLFEQNVPLVYIQKYMGHLTNEMQGYYVRPKDTYQENYAYTEKIIQEIAGEDATPIGIMGEKLKESIKAFINENKLNIYSDIEEIVKKFGNKLVIRGKSDGVCIRSKLERCSEDSKTNEVMCAYNLCPNLFHFYFMLDVTYNNFKTLQETFSVNQKNGLKKAAQKELHKVKDLIKRKLLPELDELSKELGKKGKEEIIKKYPELASIIDNYKGIRKEADEWLNIQLT